VETYCPEVHKKYAKSNVKYTGQFKTTNKVVPSYLKGLYQYLPKIKSKTCNGVAFNVAKCNFFIFFIFEIFGDVIGRKWVLLILWGKNCGHVF
jgi:hypothetical protein